MTGLTTRAWTGWLGLMRQLDTVQIDSGFNTDSMAPIRVA